MQCPACGFENMRHNITCVNCGGRLRWDEPKSRSDFMPSRAGRFKSLRSLFYFLKARVPAVTKPLNKEKQSELESFIWTDVFRGWTLVPPERRAAMAMSILPGAGHLYLGEIKKGLFFFILWLLPVSIFICLYDNSYTERYMAYVGEQQDNAAMELDAVSISKQVALYNYFSILLALASIFHAFALIEATGAQLYCRKFLELLGLILPLAIGVFLLYLLIGNLTSSSIELVVPVYNRNM